MKRELLAGQRRSAADEQRQAAVASPMKPVA
jgi:hypothetical protein